MAGRWILCFGIALAVCLISAEAATLRATSKLRGPDEAEGSLEAPAATSPAQLKDFPGDETTTANPITQQQEEEAKEKETDDDSDTEEEVKPTDPADTEMKVTQQGAEVKTEEGVSQEGDVVTGEQKIQEMTETSGEVTNTAPEVMKEDTASDEQLKTTVGAVDSSAKPVTEDQDEEIAKEA